VVRWAQFWLVLIATFAASGGVVTGRIAAAPSINCEATAAPATPATPAAMPPAASFPTEGGTLRIFAAASLTDAFTEIAGALEFAHSDLTIELNFAGSQVLLVQLTEGAEADLFAAASPAQIEAGREAGVIEGESLTFARNRLALVVPADNPAGIGRAADLARPGVKLVLAQPEVPVGQYSRQALCTMGANTVAYGEGFVDAVAANIVSEEDNVKAVMTKVQLGEADAAIVYQSDVADAPEGITVIEIPDAVNAIAAYPIAPVAGGDPELSAAFIAHLTGSEGQATLIRYGFAPP
jgi:molybdate transport system substrate-binding protein